MQVVNHFEMPTARSQVVGGLPDAPTGWTRPRMSNAKRTAAARAARAARDQNRPVGEDHAGAPVPQGIIPEGGDEINHDAGLLDPHDQNPPCEAWMGIQACGVH